MCFEKPFDNTEQEVWCPVVQRVHCLPWNAGFAYGKYFLLLKGKANSHTNSSVNSKEEHLATQTEELHQ